MCPRGEIGRHNGLKIRAFLECQFESGRGHHKMNDKIYLVFDKTKSSLKIKSFLVKKIQLFQELYLKFQEVMKKNLMFMRIIQFYIKNIILPTMVKK